MITVVSGIPHSGLSMMMQMLQAGGLEVLVDKSWDGFEPGRGKTWIDQAEGKAVQVIIQRLPDLPADRNYKVILMNRDFDEVLAEQSEILKARGESGVITQAGELKGYFEKHRLQMRAWLKQRPHFEILEVDYAKAVKSPRKQAKIIAKFLDAPLDVEAMVRCVNRNP